jgi:nitrogen-specific signal transduction histidine kinase
MTDTPHAPNPIAGYVRAAAQLLALPLSDAQVERVSVHLARTAALAAALQRLPLAADDEPSQIYEPAPFPTIDPAENPR